MAEDIDLQDRNHSLAPKVGVAIRSDGGWASRRQPTGEDCDGGHGDQ